MVFRDVKGEGYYEVVIKASLGDTITATSSKRAWFPGKYLISSKFSLTKQEIKRLTGWVLSIGQNLDAHY